MTAEGTITGWMDEAGYAVVESVVVQASVDRIAACLESVAFQGAGTRSLLDLPWCRELARSIRNHTVIGAALQDSDSAVQCTLFDKGHRQNWRVAFHQDLSVPVARRVDHPDLAGWSEKEGQVFVHAPAPLLARLLAVRLHLDACTAANGALRVISGSHRSGRLPPDRVRAARGATETVTVAARPGDALLLRPLTLHASSKATLASRRRVLHFLFAPRSPGFGLEWKNPVQ